MKKISTILAALMSLASGMAHGYADHDYVANGSNVKPLFDVYNDGKNTYVEAAKGVTVKGAKREGDSFVVQGTPAQIDVLHNGKKLVVVRVNQTQGEAAFLPASPSATTWVATEVQPSDQVRTDIASAKQVDQMQAELASLKLQLAAQQQNIVPPTAMGNSPAITPPAATRQADTPETKSSAVGNVSGASPTPPETGEFNDPSKASLPYEATAPKQGEAIITPPKGEASEKSSAAKRVDLIPELPVLNEPTVTKPDPEILKTIKRGTLIDAGLKARAEAEGWTFFWYPTIHWEAIGDIDLSRYKTADEAVDDIVTGLREEGKQIQLRISDGNKIMEIISTEVKND